MQPSLPACLHEWFTWSLYSYYSPCGMFVILPLINKSILHLRPLLLSLLPWLRWETQLELGCGYIRPLHDCQLWSIYFVLFVCYLYLFKSSQFMSVPCKGSFQFTDCTSWNYMCTMCSCFSLWSVIVIKLACHHSWFYSWIWKWAIQWLIMVYNAKCM